MYQSRRQRYFKKPVFQEAVRATPSHITGRNSSPPHLPESIPATLADSSFVYMCHGSTKTLLFSAYSGPFAVIACFPKYFILDMGDRQELVSADLLKPHLGSPIFTLAMALCHGRPLKLVPQPGAPLGGE